MKGRTAEGIGRLADPKITLASVASLVLGLGAAARHGPLSPEWLALTVAGVLFVEVAKNASGEVFHFDSGADLGVRPEDRSPFSGGKRVIVDGALSRGETATVAAVGYAAATAVGLAIALVREPRVLAFAVAGAALAYFYHAPPLRLSYRGLGEAAVVLAYGPLIACGAFLVQRGAVTADVVLASLPIGMLIGAFLWINEFPDFVSDRAAGKRTLVVRLGRDRAARAFAGIVGAAYALLLVLPLAGVPATVLCGLAGLPHGVAAARRLASDPARTADLIPAQAWTLLSFLLCAAGAGLGLAFGPRAG